MQPETQLPPVSILMLTYNRAHFIHEAIASVVNQTYQNWELFVIDDGSTDDTQVMVTAFGDSRIKYIKHEENAGLFVRRKESLDYASGKYTAILDSDDVWTEPNKLTDQVNFLETYLNYVVVGTQTILIDEKGQRLGQSNFSTNNAEIRSKILVRNQFTHSSILMRTEALKKTDGYLPTLAEDLELILQLGNIGLLANLPSFYTAHRVHANSANDHGLKMAVAVNSIVYKHANEYPRSIYAKFVSLYRMSVGGIKRAF
jgi:glycosyltransferase involved in cell wall biosynthesis